MKCYVVFEANGLFAFKMVAVYKNEADAKAFCDEQNLINQPEYDDWGHCDGMEHSYTEMELKDKK